MAALATTVAFMVNNKQRIQIYNIEEENIMAGLDRIPESHEAYSENRTWMGELNENAIASSVKLVTKLSEATGII